MATILYVEDHPPAQMLMQAIVEEMTDHRLVLAPSSGKAVQLTRTTPPDLYIIDIDLPDGDGLTLARTLIDIHAAPVMLVSAYAEAVETDALSYIYLAKPLDPDHVARTIHRTLA